MRETRVWALGWEESLEKEMASHSSITWKIPWTEEPGRLQSMESQRVGHDWATSLHFTWDDSLCNMRHWKIKHPCIPALSLSWRNDFFFFFLPCPGVSWYLYCYLLQDDLVQSRSSFSHQRRCVLHHCEQSSAEHREKAGTQAPEGSAIPVKPRETSPGGQGIRASIS